MREKAIINCRGVKEVREILFVVVTVPDAQEFCLKLQSFLLYIKYFLGAHSGNFKNAVSRCIDQRRQQYWL